MKSLFRKWLAYNDGFVVSGRYLSRQAWLPGGQLLRSRLGKKLPEACEPCMCGSVIHLNETYMDVVDWAYHKSGPIDVLWLFGCLAPAFGIICFYLDAYFSRNPDYFFYDSIVTIVFLPVVVWFGLISWKTFVGCTHYPVRLDRRQRRVHVFRNNGDDGVDSYRWEDIEFGLSGGGADQRGFSTGVMIGYVKKLDGSYEYFRLGVMWPSDEGMYSQWEYYRRYMEEGPESVPEPEILLPIDGQRESFRLGAQFCWFFGGPEVALAIFLAPLTVPGSLLRWIIMHVTRKLPRWPQYIIDQCPISPHDKYAYKPRKNVDVSYDLAFFVTASVLALDGALLYWFVDFLSQPGYH